MTKPWSRFLPDIGIYQANSFLVGKCDGKYLIHRPWHYWDFLYSSEINVSSHAATIHWFPRWISVFLLVSLCIIFIKKGIQ